VNGCQRPRVAIGLLALLVVAGVDAIAEGPTDPQFPGSFIAAENANRVGDGAAPFNKVSLRREKVDEPFSAEKLKRLMKPIFSFEAELYGRTDDVELASYDGKIKFPTYPIFGPPPPFFSVGFGYTNINSPASFDLPSDLYESSIGVSWMRKRNERWMFRSMLGVANATDGDNNSSDSWQFRGGIFAIYTPCPEWTWTFGAIALGRNDIPVVPAIGLIYQPRPEVRYDLIFPRPRASFLLTDNGRRQNWGYVGGALNGGTWGYQRDSGLNDQLTYRSWQLVLGWESTPMQQPGMPFALGRKFGAEFGYAFGRQFEFESERADLELGDTIILRATISL